MRLQLGAAPSRPLDSVTKAYSDANAGSGGGGGSSTLPSRATVMTTSPSIASGANDTTTKPVIGLGFTLYAIQTSRPARVQLYSTAAAMAADANRAVGTDPQPYDSGIILDYVTPDAKTHILSPMVPGANMESTPTTSISMRVTNNDTVTGTVSVTFTFLRTE